MKNALIKIGLIFTLTILLAACFMPTKPTIPLDFAGEVKPMALIDHQSLVESLVRDDAKKIDNNDYVKAVDSAVSRYSKDRPRTVVEDVVAPGGQYLNLPNAWQTNFSNIASIESPIGNVPPTLLAIGNYGMYNAPGTQQIMMRSSINVGQSVRINFTSKHKVNETTDTTPEHEREAIAAWAAAVCCEQLASYYAGDSDATIDADSVQNNSKSRDFASRAKVFRKRYFNELGIDPKRNIAAGTVVNMDLASSQGNDRFTHPNRRR